MINDIQSMTTVNITTLCIMPLSFMTLSIMTPVMSSHWGMNTLSLSFSNTYKCVAWPKSVRFSSAHGSTFISHFFSTDLLHTFPANSTKSTIFILVKVDLVFLLPVRKSYNFV